MTDKRQLLIETAFTLFYQHGVNAVGINQILKQANVAKKTLYTHFSSKEKLVESVLAYRDERFISWLTQRLERKEAGKAALLSLFNALDDWFNNRVEQLANFNGCFFINTTADYGDPASIPHQLCADHKKRVRELIERQVRCLNVDEPGELTDMLSMLKEGAIVTAQVQGDKQAALKARQLAEQLLETHIIQKS